MPRSISRKKIGTGTKTTGGLRPGVKAFIKAITNPKTPLRRRGR